MASTRANKSGSARKTAFKTLRRKIINMEYLPGAPLSENELAREMGVSRTPVREALILLSDIGLVNVYPKRGTFVAHLDPKDVIDAQFLREAVELHSLASLELPADAEIIAQIDENLTQQRAAIEVGPNEFFQLDEEFHVLLLELSGHARLWEIVSDYKTHLDRARILGLQTKPALRGFYEDHVSIAEEIKAGDLARAQTKLQSHLRVILDDLEAAQNSYSSIFVFSSAPRAV